MNRKIEIVWGILLLACLHSFSQSQNGTTCLKELLKDTRTVPFIGWENQKTYLNLDGTLFANGQRLLIKNNKGLFIFINGSGRLYRVIEKDGVVNCIRLDSTTYFGYNIGSFAFSYNDSIFSLGGYGFWRVNGQLRVYSETYHQWDIVKLNEEIPLLFDGRTDLIHYDWAAKKIFIGASFERNEAIKTDSVDEAKRKYYVAFLDLQNKKWYHVGILNNYVVERITQIKSLTSCPWGELITLGNKVILMDYSNNMLLSLNSAKEAIVLQGTFNHPGSSENIFFCKDSTLFWANNLLNTLDSLPLKKNDFNLTNKSIYTSNVSAVKKNSILEVFWPLLFASILLSAVLLLPWIIYKRNIHKYKTKPQEITTDNNGKQYFPNDHAQYKDLFDEKERLILQLLVENSLKGSTTKVEEINKMLGLTKKSIEIQKKQRSDIILSINRKYAFAKTEPSTIIQKKRSDFDKRSFEYYIEYSTINDLQNFLTLSI